MYFILLADIRDGWDVFFFDGLSDFRQRHSCHLTDLMNDVNDGENTVREMMMMMNNE